MPDDYPLSPLNTQAQASPGLFAPKRLFQNWLNFSLDLLFPPRCAGCGRVDAHWCDQCQDDLDLIPYPRHITPIDPLTAVATTAHHRGVIREAVQALKYSNSRKVAEPLGERLAYQLAAQNWTIDILIPVPLHTARLAERGYNQAQLLGEEVTKKMLIPCVPNALRRERSTQSQVTVSAAERRVNVQKAFTADPDLVSNRIVLLIDDVYTTGATMSACAEALLASGAQAVFGLTATAAHI